MGIKPTVLVLDPDQVQPQIMQSLKEKQEQEQKQDV